jgi:hexosaminidase
MRLPFAAVFVAAAGLTAGAGCAPSERAARPPSQPEAQEERAAPAQQGTAPAAKAERYPLIPWPRRLEPREGAFVLDEKTRVLVSAPSGQGEKARAPAEALATLVRRAATLPMRVTPMRETPGASVSDQPKNTIAFVLTGSDVSSEGGATGVSNTPGEGEAEGRYELAVTPRVTQVRAPTPKGLFYGMQTLRQLLPPRVEKGLGYDDGRIEWTVPAVRVADAPRFPYRGMHLDVSRHFFDVSFIKQYIDLLARYKVDTFHWHLTDDQGWRIEIEQYPRLTGVGGCRDSSMVGSYDAQTYDDSAYCGYYTQEDVKEVVRYAQERHVTVIPEIEMPGHARAALAAYPELGCTTVSDSSYTVATSWGIHEQIYCPKEKTFTVLENVLTEVMALFPSEYIHIGGDEAPKAQWEESAVAQRVMRREELDSEEALQSYFIRRIEDFLNANGRKLIGWDEILQGGLPPDATVMSWRGPAGGIRAARQGHDAIMTPTDYLYFDYYQGPPETEPLAIGGNLPLEKVYGYDPVPDSLSRETTSHIIGTQANVWTEYMTTPQKVEYMAYPRALALAEIAWSPQRAREWAFFKARLPAHLRRLDALGIGYRTPDFLEGPEEAR